MSQSISLEMTGIHYLSLLRDKMVLWCWNLLIHFFVLDGKNYQNATNELKFGIDMYFYWFYQIPEDLAKIFTIAKFMGEELSFSAFSVFRNRSRKWPNKLQLSWNLDQTCISMGSIKFQKVFAKFWKLTNLWPKNYII